MLDAHPRPRRARRNGPTRYEVAARHEDGRRVVVGFTARTTRRGLLNVMQARGEELVALMNLQEDGPKVSFARDGAGRWKMDFGRGWRVGFTGRTERQVACDPHRFD